MFVNIAKLMLAYENATQVTLMNVSRNSAEQYVVLPNSSNNLLITLKKSDF